MTSLIKTESELSPLDQVRQTEADVAGKIASARDDARKKEAHAKSQAKDLLDDARRIGQREGKKRYRDIISNAEEEAQVIVVDAHISTEHLHRRAGQRLAVGVRHALNVVIGLEVAGDDK